MWFSRLLAVVVLAVLLGASSASLVTAGNGDQIGGITIAKQTTNGDHTTKFDFTSTLDDSPISLLFSIAGGEHYTQGFPPTGTYTVVETVPPGWVLIEISCSITVLTDDVVGSFGVMSYRVSESPAQYDLAHQAQISHSCAPRCSPLAC